MDLGDPQSLNPYSYADDNPVAASDPTGLKCMQGDMESGCADPGSSADVTPHTRAQAEASNAGEAEVAGAAWAASVQAAAEEDAYYDYMTEDVDWCVETYDSYVSGCAHVTTSRLQMLQTQAAQDAGAEASRGFFRAVTFDPDCGGWSCLAQAAVLIPGWGEFAEGVKAVRGLEAATDAVRVASADIESGVYVVNSADGVYVGQSGNIARRLAEHVRSGKFTTEEVANAGRQGVVGGRTAREIAEQAMIDRLGGIDSLLNVVNPIGSRRFELMPNQPYWR